MKKKEKEQQTAEGSWFSMPLFALNVWTTDPGQYTNIQNLTKEPQTENTRGNSDDTLHPPMTQQDHRLSMPPRVRGACVQE